MDLKKWSVRLPLLLHEFILSVPNHVFVPIFPFFQYSFIHDLALNVFLKIVPSAYSPEGYKDITRRSY